MAKKRRTPKKTWEELRKGRESFQARKLLFGLVALSQTVNAFVLAGLFGGKIWYLVALLLFLTVVVLVDRRKTHVDWFYAVFISIFFFGAIAFTVFSLKVYWLLWIWGPELAAFAVCTPLVYRSVHKK